MGRPIKQVYIGDTGTAGSQIQVTGYVTGGSAQTGYINKQKGSKRYKVTTGDGTEVLTLVTSGSLSAGQMYINATDSAGGTYYVQKLYDRTVYLVPNTGIQFSASTHVSWNLTGAVNGVSVILDNA